MYMYVKYVCVCVHLFVFFFYQFAIEHVGLYMDIFMLGFTVFQNFL